MEQGDGAGGPIYVSEIQPDGKILISGSILHYDGVRADYIARLNANGTLDASFTGKGDFNIQAIAVQAYI